MLNKVHLIGNLGNDPIMKTLDGGQTVTELRLATTDRWKNKSGEKQERTEWHTIVIWGKTAEVAAEYLKKGSKIYIEGRIQYRSWDDENGNKRYKTEIVADKMQMLDSKSSSPSREPVEAPVGAGASDDLPF